MGWQIFNVMGLIPSSLQRKNATTNSPPSCSSAHPPTSDPSSGPSLLHATSPSNDRGPRLLALSDPEAPPQRKPQQGQVQGLEPRHILHRYLPSDRIHVDPDDCPAELFRTVHAPERGQDRDSEGGGGADTKGGKVRR